MDFFLGLCFGGGIFLLVGIAYGNHDYSELEQSYKNEEDINRRLRNELNNLKKIR